jgi:hypothetical protein
MDPKLDSAVETITHSSLGLEIRTLPGPGAACVFHCLLEVCAAV